MALRDQASKPTLAGTAKPTMGRKPKTWSASDDHDDTARTGLQTLFEGLGLGA